MKGGEGGLLALDEAMRAAVALRDQMDHDIAPTAPFIQPAYEKTTGFRKEPSELGVRLSRQDACIDSECRSDTLAHLW